MATLHRPHGAQQNGKCVETLLKSLFGDKAEHKTVIRVIQQACDSNFTNFTQFPQAPRQA